jgi:hypothetical protein
MYQLVYNRRPSLAHDSEVESAFDGIVSEVWGVLSDCASEGGAMDLAASCARLVACVHHCDEQIKSGLVCHRGWWLLVKHIGFLRTGLTVAIICARVRPVAHLAKMGKAIGALGVHGKIPASLAFTGLRCSRVYV